MEYIFTYYTENNNTYQERWKYRTGIHPNQPQPLIARMHATVPCTALYAYDLASWNPSFTGDYVRNPTVACNTALAGERIVRVDVEARGDVYALVLCALGNQNGTRSTTHTYFYGVSTLNNVAFTPTNGSICPNVNYPVTATTTPFATSYEWQLAEQVGTTRTGLGAVWSTTSPSTQFSVPIAYTGRSISVRGRAVRSGQPGCNNGRSAWNYAAFRPVSAVPAAATGLFFSGPVTVGSPTSILLQPPQDSPVPVASYQWTCSRQGTGPVNLFAGGLFTANSTSTAVGLTFPIAGIYTFNVQSLAAAGTTCGAGATYSQTFSIGILPACPLQTEVKGTKTIYNKVDLGANPNASFTGIKINNFDPTLTYSFGIDQILPLGSRNIESEILQNYNSSLRGIQFWIERRAPYNLATNPQTFRLTTTVSSGNGAPVVCRQTITIPPPCPETPLQCPPPPVERPAAGNGGGVKRFSVWPNPIAGDYLTITAPANERCLKASLYTLQGQEVRSVVAPEPKGAMELQIPVTDLRKGTYLLRTFDGAQSEVTRVVIQ